MWSTRPLDREHLLLSPKVTQIELSPPSGTWLRAIATGWLALLVGCQGDRVLFPVTQVPGAETADPLVVNVIQVQRDERPYLRSVCYGTLAPRRQSRLGFPRGGRVKAVYKQLGDRVPAGELLAELEQDQLENDKRALERALARAREAASDTAPTSAQQLQRLESQLVDLNGQLAGGKIFAPYDSLVTHRNVEAGTVISPATAAFQVIEDAPPWVQAQIPREVAARWSTGESVTIDLGGNVATAKSSAQSPLQDAAAGQRVLFEFTEALPPGWSFGQVVEIQFALPSSKPGFWLPLSALQRASEGAWSAYVVVPDDANDGGPLHVERRLLEIIETESTAALVEGGLENGDLVVAHGTHRIVAGQRVSTVDVSNEFVPPLPPGATE